MKRAIKRLIRGDDGRLRIIYVDLETLLPVTDLTGYRIVSAGSASEEPEPVESVDRPDSISQSQFYAGGRSSQRGGGGGGALEGRRPPSLSPNYFPPAPTSQARTRQVTTPRVSQPIPGASFPGRPDVTQVEIPEVIGPDGKKITDPKEIQKTVVDFVAQDPERAATELLSDRLVGGAKERGADYALSNMDPELRDRLVDMIEAAPPEIGAGLQIHSGYRSPEHQDQLYTLSQGSGMVAPKGRSQHGFGAAADLSWNGMNLGTAPLEVRDWIHANAPNFGLNFPMNDPNKRPYEPWHIETIEARTGKPWTPPEATVPSKAPRGQVPIGGGLALGPVGGNLYPVSGVPMSPVRSDFLARPEFVGSLPAEDAQRGPFPARPEGPVGSLPMTETGPFLPRPEGPASSLPENAKGDRVGTGPFSAPILSGVTPSFVRPEGPVSSLPMAESGPFSARPEFIGSLPAEDAQIGPFLGRPGFAGSLPAEDAQRGPFLSRPEYTGSLPAKRTSSFISPDKEMDRSLFGYTPLDDERFPSEGIIPEFRDTVAEKVIKEAGTPASILAEQKGMTVNERRSFADKTPAYFAANGLVDRSAEQIRDIARAFSGELSGDQLRALENGDPIAQRELANMMVTLENRAASRFFGGSFDKALNGSYDSINKSWAIPNTDANYKLHGGAVENFVSDWYKGVYNDLVDNWNNSNYYNPLESNPSWGIKMNDPTMVGEHTFGSLGEYGPTGSWQASRSAFASGPYTGYGPTGSGSGAFAQREGQGTFGTSASPGVGRSSLGVNSPTAQREGQGTFGTSASPGVGRSSLGVSGPSAQREGTNRGASGSTSSGGYTGGGPTGSPSRSTSSGGYTGGGPTGGSSTTSRSSAPSAGGYTGSPTSDGYAGSKTPGGGF